jgi:hypothetical protein
MQPPPVCRIVSVLPDSPAQKAGLQVGDTLEKIMGTAPKDALAAGDLLEKATDQAMLSIRPSSGTTRHVAVALNRERPRLGASCDLNGWSQKGVSSVGNESLTVYQGPYNLTVSGIFDKGLAFMRVRVSNFSNQPLSVGPEAFSATDGQNSAVTRLNPSEVIYFMHGADALAYLKPPDGQTVPGVEENSPARTASTPHKPKAEWSHSEEEYVRTNANYLSKESLWPGTVKPGQSIEGLIYFRQPASQPFTVSADINGSALKVGFGDPQPSTQRMTQEELIRFFNGLKKGTAVRLTLKTGTVFSGKYSSYDDLNETVWFDTPSGVLLTTSSFGLRSITYAEVLTPVK